MNLYLDDDTASPLLAKLLHDDVYHAAAGRKAWRSRLEIEN